MIFHKVIVVYNPNSTGDSESNAKNFVTRLKAAKDTLEIELTATKYAGHAEEIAFENADDHDTLIISSSGDGGYNEVVNGVRKADGKAAVAVLPSGNANDHHRAVGKRDLVDAIVDGKDTYLELIEVAGTVEGKEWRRYAHSYVGLGLTPEAGLDMTERRPNAISEKWHALRHVLTFTHVTLRIQSKKKRYNNLVFAVIDRMSKVIKLDKTASQRDGLMEVYANEYESPFRSLWHALSAGTVGLSSVMRSETFEFATVRTTPIQLDGEVEKLDGGVTVTVTCHKGALRTVV